VKCAPPAVSAANGVRSALYNALNRGVTAEEKLHLRAKLLELVREDSPQVAIQLALIVAKVARTDYPRDWCVPCSLWLSPPAWAELQSAGVLTHPARRPTGHCFACS
jgi:hypothetical protein